jgi:hypothetical protein
MPTLPTLIVFQINLESEEPGLFIKGNVYAAGEPIHPVKQDWVVKKAHPAAGQVVANDYFYVFNVTKKGKFELSAVTAAVPEPIPMKFNIESDDGRLGLVFRFKVM